MVQAGNGTSADNYGRFAPVLGARYALALRDAAQQTLAMLDAIEAAEYLEPMPVEVEKRAGYCTALTLLECARRALAKVLADDTGETALIFLAGDLGARVDQDATRPPDWN